MAMRSRSSPSPLGPTPNPSSAYNVQGQLVRTLMDALLHAGVHLARWDGRDELGHSAATGPYFARLRIGHGPPRYTKLLLLR